MYKYKDIHVCMYIDISIYTYRSREIGVDWYIGIGIDIDIDLNIYR